MFDSAKLAVLISGRGSNLRSIVQASADGTLSAEIALVISNVNDAAGLDIAREHGIRTCVIRHTEFPDRDAFDLALLKQLQAASIDVIVLAGFMRILTEPFVEAWRGALLNIHPSLLPLYPGLHTHEQVLAAGDSQSGASVHFVTPLLDGGPVIVQGVVDVEPTDSTGTLAAKVLPLEHAIYPMAIEWLVTNRITLQHGFCYFDGVRLVRPHRWYNNQLQLQSETE